jgi:type II secretory pathway pseudopilin PulG
MTTRDRLVLMGIVTLVVLVGGWFGLVSPERQKASKVDAQVSAAHLQLETARSQVASAQSAQTKYQSAYASMVRLGKAVPPEAQIPSLVYQLDKASNQKDVNFSSIIDTGVTAQSAASPSTTTTAATAPAGFTAVPFTFIFKGSYFSLYHLFNQLNRFVLNTASGSLQVTGRLLTIQDANLDLKEAGAESTGSEGQLTGTITATAYILPASESSTGGATASGPAGTASGTQPATGSGTSSAPTTAAVVKVNP